MVIFSHHRQKIIMQEKICRDQVLPQVTVRSLVPSLRHVECSSQFYFQQIGGGVEIAIESHLHADKALLDQEVLRRILLLQMSFTKTMNVHMTNALATAPSVICEWLSRSLNEASEVLKQTHVDPARWINEALTRQLTSFCPSQFRNVSKRQPIRDLVQSLAFTSSEDDQRSIFLATTSTVAELLMKNNDTITLPETRRIFYFEEENGRLQIRQYKPLRSYPGTLGTREPATLPVIQVDCKKLPILRMPDLHDENGQQASSFVNHVRAMFVVPIGYTLRHIPAVSLFRDVNFNAVRMTVFDQGGEDGEMQWHRDILCRSGLNDPALYDPHRYGIALLVVEGGEAAAKAYQSCYRGHASYEERVFSSTGITPRDPEWNLAVSNHVLYVGKSFGRKISAESVYGGPDPASKFRTTGIDGNRPLCSAMGYLQAARSAIANMHDMKADAETCFDLIWKHVCASPSMSTSPKPKRKAYRHFPIAPFSSGCRRNPI